MLNNKRKCVIHEIIQVKHLRIIGLIVKFDNYHSKKKGVLTEIWNQTQKLILTLQNAL